VSGFLLLWKLENADQLQNKTWNVSFHMYWPTVMSGEFRSVISCGLQKMTFIVYIYILQLKPWKRNRKWLYLVWRWC